MPSREPCALKIRFFGTPSFETGQRSLVFAGPPKAIPLLAYILLHRDAPISREKLAFSLWPDTSDVDARANVRRHLHYVQRFLREIDPGYGLEIEGATVRWNPKRNVEFDVADFEALSSRPDTYADATTLYGGDLLADYYDDWIFPHRERLRARYVHILDEVIRSERSLRNFAQAQHYVALLLAHDPWREDAVRHLMELRYAVGDRSGALAQYEEFAKRLAEDAAVAPMSDTTAIYEGILRNAPIGLDEAPVEPLNATNADTTVLPFIGRDSVFDSLSTHWERAARGHGSVALISGEPGIGKTRCARELAMHAESQGARLLIGTVSFPESQPYQPLVEALRLALPMLSTLEVDPVWLSALSTLIPEVRERAPSIPEPPSLDSRNAQTRLLEGIAQVLEALARARPLLLILEDLHWAGAVTIAAIEFLARRVSRLPLMIIATYREDEVGRTHQLRAFRRRLEREALSIQVPLGRLPLTAVLEMAQKCGLTQAEDVAPRLFTQSEGNPFLLTEAIRDYQTAPGDWAQELHGRAQDLIEKRILALSASAVALAECAAVIGASFDLELLRELCGWSERDLFSGLDELIARFIVRQASQPHIDYSFSHHLFQRAIYARMPEDQRRSSHRRAARALLELYPERVEDFAVEIALHMERAAEADEAAEYNFKAAQRAQRFFANEEALDLLERALVLAPAHPLRFEFLALREDLCGRIGNRAMQADALDALEDALPADAPDAMCFEVLYRRAAYWHAVGERAAEETLIAALLLQCERAGDRKWLAKAAILKAQYLESIGELQAATALTKEALAEYTTSDAPEVAATMCLLGELHSTSGRYAEAHALFAHVLQREDIERTVMLHIRVLRAATRSAIEQRNFEQARASGNELLLLCRRSGDREGEADAHTRLAAATARAGKIQAAESHYLAASSLYASFNKPQGEAAVLTNRGLLFFIVGQFNKALQSYSKAQTLFTAINDLRGKTVCALNSSQCHLYLGSFSDSKRSAQDALALAQALTSPSLEATALANVGAADRELGNHTLAIDEMKAGIAIRRGLDEPSDLASDLCDLALAYVAANDINSAADVLTELQRFEKDRWAGMLFPQYFPWVCARVSRAAGDLEGASTFLSLAHSELKNRVAQIDYAPYRQSYRRLRFNLEMQRAFKQDLWPSAFV